MQNTRFIDQNPKTVRGSKKDNKLIKFAKNSFEAFKKGIDKILEKHLDDKKATAKSEYATAYQDVRIAAAEVKKGVAESSELEKKMSALNKAAYKLIELDTKKRLKVEEQKTFKMKGSTLSKIAATFKAKTVDISKKIAEKDRVSKAYQEANDRLYYAAKNNNNDIFNSELSRLRDYNNYSAVNKTVEASPVEVKPVVADSIQKTDEKTNNDNITSSWISSMFPGVEKTAVEKVEEASPVEVKPIVEESVEKVSSNSEKMTGSNLGATSLFAGAAKIPSKITSEVSSTMGKPIVEESYEKTDNSKVSLPNEVEAVEKEAVSDEQKAFEQGRKDAEKYINDVLGGLRVPEVKTTSYEDSKNEFYDLLNARTTLEPAKESVLEQVEKTEDVVPTNNNEVTIEKIEQSKISEEVKTPTDFDGMSLEQLNQYKVALEAAVAKKTQENHTKIGMFHGKDEDDYLNWYNYDSAVAYNTEKQEQVKQVQEVKNAEEIARFNERTLLREKRAEILAKQAAIEAELADINNELNVSYVESSPARKI